ncbi:MAG: hypothetical protein P4M09_22925 [Devosia sp.]|nr:hypothetical protein [Devosia sp.]
MISYALIVTMLAASHAPTDYPKPVAKVVEAHLAEFDCRAKAMILQQHNNADFTSYVCLVDGVGE